MYSKSFYLPEGDVGIKQLTLPHDLCEKVGQFGPYAVRSNGCYIGFEATFYRHADTERLFSFREIADLGSPESFKAVGIRDRHFVVFPGQEILREVHITSKDPETVCRVDDYLQYVFNDQKFGKSVLVPWGAIQ